MTWVRFLRIGIKNPAAKLWQVLEIKRSSEMAAPFKRILLDFLP
jgi:hypothetical protein